MSPSQFFPTLIRREKRWQTMKWSIDEAVETPICWRRETPSRASPKSLRQCIPLLTQVAAPGPGTGFDRACPECPVKSRMGPIMGFDRGSTGIWAGPVRACRWCPMVARTNPFDLALGKPWAIPKRVALARTGPSVPVVPGTNPVRDKTGNVIWVGSVHYLHEGGQENLNLAAESYIPHPSSRNQNSFGVWGYKVQVVL